MTIALLLDYTKPTLEREAENKHQNQACIRRIQLNPHRWDLASKGIQFDLKKQKVYLSTSQVLMHFIVDLEALGVRFKPDI